MSKVSKTSILMILVGFIIILIAVLALAISKSGSLGTEPSSATGMAYVDEENFQAVFLSNDQVYFGKLSSAGGDTLKLTKVHYLSDDEQTLMRLGTEVHRPQDAMYIPKESIVFWENLQSSAMNGQLQ